MLARYDTIKRNVIYHTYVTDALKILGNLNVRYADLIVQKEVETRTPEEIISNVKSKIKKLGDS